MGRDFRNIKAWQYADFPKEESYGITSQLRRAAVSIPTNIAEGAGRDHYKEYLQFLNIAVGSISEVAYLLHLSNRLCYLKNSDYEGIEEVRIETAKTLHGLINAVKKDNGIET